LFWRDPANLVLTDRLVRRFYDEPLPERGAYLFFITHKAGDPPGRMAG